MLLTAGDAAKANSAAKKLGKVGRVEPLALDVANAPSIKKAAAEVATRYGYLHVLVNNAGINYDTWETASMTNLCPIERGCRVVDARFRIRSVVATRPRVIDSNGGQWQQTGDEDHGEVGIPERA